MQIITQFAAGVVRLFVRTAGCLLALGMLLGIAVVLEDFDFWVRAFWGSR